MEGVVLKFTPVVYSDHIYEMSLRPSERVWVYDLVLHL